MIKVRYSNSSENKMNNTPEIPWLRPRVREIVEELFQNQLQWKTADLLNAACRIHEERNGRKTDRPEHTLRRVLTDMKNDGLIFAPGHGHWISDSTEGNEIEDKEENEFETLELATEPSEPLFPAEKEIGEGSECVYVYFNPNDRKLALAESRIDWECKVGRTSSSEVTLRLISQGVSTALSRPPILGLLIRTDKSSLVEKILHNSLRLASSNYDDAIGTEWFMTSPQAIEAWYLIFQSSISALSGEQEIEMNSEQGSGGNG